jgi:hypothetical protein
LEVGGLEDDWVGAEVEVFEVLVATGFAVVVFEAVAAEDLQAEVSVTTVKAALPTTMPARCKNSRLEKLAGLIIAFFFWISLPSSGILFLHKICKIIKTKMRFISYILVPQKVNSNSNDKI